jgi:hypothetical protein
MADKITEISSLAEYIDEIHKVKKDDQHELFYRGHANSATYKLVPSIYRNFKRIRNEDVMIKEAILRCPGEFSDADSQLDRIVKLQHYGMPTRLLDISKNSLAALYFACKEFERTVGEVVIFKIPKDEIKYYDSDAVAIISNLSLMRRDFDITGFPDDVTDFNKQVEIRRLIHFVKQDKPGFLSKIQKDTLGKVLCVKTRLSNKRITSQGGAFLLFGIDGKKTKPAQIPSSWTIKGTDVNKIVFRNKFKLMRELSYCGISESTLFPELENQAKDILKEFEGKYRRKKKKKRSIKSP